MRSIAPVLLFALLLAGCSGSPETESPERAPEARPAPVVSATAWQPDPENPGWEEREVELVDKRPGLGPSVERRPIRKNYPPARELGELFYGGASSETSTLVGAATTVYFYDRLDEGYEVGFSAIEARNAEGEWVSSTDGLTVELVLRNGSRIAPEGEPIRSGAFVRGWGAMTGVSLRFPRSAKLGELVAVVFRYGEREVERLPM